MKNVNVNFLPSRTQTPLGVLMLLSALVTLSACGLQYIHVQQAHLLAEARHASRMAQSERIKEEAEQRAKQHAAPLLADGRWIKASAELRRPWMSTLGVMEQLAHPPIYILALRPDATSGRIHIEAESPRVEDMIAFLSEVQKNALLQHAQLVSHETLTSTAGPTGTIKFVLQAPWSETP